MAADAAHELPGQITVRPDGLHAALLAAKAQIPPLPKHERATVQTRSGGSYEYRYASLGDTKKAVDPVLQEHGLLWRTFPGGTHEKPMLGYAMTHVPTGEQEQGEMPIFGIDTSQAHGSGITYGRRYAVWAYLDLVGDEDDDGQAASQGRGGGSADRHNESRAERGGVDMRGEAKGLRDDTINAARASVGLPHLDKPWASLMNIPEHLAPQFAQALEAAKAAQ